MAAQLAVADVERLVLDEQADDLAVGDVDDGLAVLGVAVAGLGVGQRAHLVEAVEVGAGQAVRLALVEVAAQPDVAVGQREHRLGLGQHVEVQLGLADRPRLDRERRVLDHELVEQLGQVLDDDVGAVLRAAPSAWPTRSTPTTKPKPPARPACTPASASSNTAACAGSTPSARGPGQERVRRGLALQVLLASATCAVDARLEQVLDAGGDQHVAAVGARGDDRAAQARVAGGLDVADRALVGLDARARWISLQHELVLAVAEPADRLGVGRIVGRPLGQLDPARLQERAHAVVARLAVDVLVVVVDRVELARTARRSARRAPRRYSSNVCFQAAAWTLAVWVSTPSRSNRQAVTASGNPSMRRNLIRRGPPTA